MRGDDDEDDIMRSMRDFKGVHWLSNRPICKSE